MDQRLCRCLCIFAFKYGDYNLAVRMLAEVQHSEAITTEFRLSRDVSLLHLAAYHGWLDIVARLRIKVVTKDSLGQTPLHYAAAGGNLKMVKYLYKQQKASALGQHSWLNDCCGDPSSQDIDGCTPLHCASKNGHVNIVQYLAELGCDPTCQNNHGYTPLHYASQYGRMNIIRYLTKELGCDPVGKKCEFFLQYKQFSFQTNKTTTIQVREKLCLPLHLACYCGHLRVVKYFTDELKCEPTIPGEFRATPLHYACDGGKLNIVRYLVKKKGCDLKDKYSCHKPPIAFACHRGHLNIIKYFATLKNFNPNDLLGYGHTLLHLAATGDNADVIKYLINECGCRETLDKFGLLPVHYACVCGRLNTVRGFINEQNCNDPSCRDLIGRTPLHHACTAGHMNIIHCLVTELGCDSRIADKTGTLPIHVACQAGHLDVLKYLIAKQSSDPTVRGRNGWTLLHYATMGGHLNIIKYLITELQCDPLIADDNSKTILQVATNNEHDQIVEYLLHNGWCSPQGITKAKLELLTCIDVARHTRNRYKLLRLFQPLAEITKTFDIHTFSKVILIGNSSAGKSTLAKVISERATTYFNFFRFGNVLQVETNTAGIIPAHIKSWEIGKIVLYDLAGQTEYHSSHSALMEIAMQQFSATFILVVDLHDEDTKMIQKLHYWLNFADNATSRTNDKSCLIVIGSHADLLSNEQIKDKFVLIANILEEVSFMRCFGTIAMDCRKINSSGTCEFVQLLCKTHETMVNKAPKMSYYCHLLYAFLQYEHIVVCTLEELAKLLAADDDCPIPLEYSFLTELLVTLSNKGIVVFLKDHIIQNSWVVAETDVLLKDINGILFTPKEFKEHHEVSSSTGIVRSSSLQQLLPQYNLQMLVSFLELLEICHHVDLSVVTTNLQKIGVSSSDDDHHESLLFFPCLLEIQQPSVLLSSEEGMFSNWFGWCLSCKHQKYCFFTSRFLHVLLLRLIGTFPLADSDATASSHHQQKRCTVWTNGISWDNEEGIRTIVELIDQNQRVVVVMSHTTESRPLECSKHRSAVIRLIRDLKEKLFPKLDVDEYLISPDLLKNWPSEDVCLPDEVLCPMENVAKSMLLQKPWILSLKGELKLRTEKTMLNEPYYQLSTFSVCELLNEKKADEPVPQNLLNEVNTRCSLSLSEQHTHLSLREVIEEFSIFSGLKPIVSS